MKNFYTIDDLVTLCKQNNFSHFSSKERDGVPLLVHSLETFEVSGDAQKGLLPVKLKSCHIGVNRNKSGISEEVMNACKDSFKGRPILGSIIETDTGEYEFHSHDMELNEDGSVDYIEQPVGVVSQTISPYLEYDKEEDKTYLMVEGYVFEDYSRASEILKRRKTCKCSVEVAINEMSWNCEEDYLSIDDFYFLGVTILGYEQDGVTEIQEGMKGSKITIDSFDAGKNSLFSSQHESKIIELLSSIKDKIDSLPYVESNQKGVDSTMNHFEELLEKYGVTAEECEFDYENMTDDELDAKFEEVFKCKTKKKCDNDEEVVEDGADDVDTNEDEFKCKKKKCDTDEDEEVEDNSDPEEFEESEESEIVEDESEDKFELKFELSHEDIRTGLYNLLAASSEDGYFCTWILSVFDNSFIYEDFEDGKYYKQGYSRTEDSLQFDGERVQVYSEWLTADERDALNTLKSEYATLKEFKETYDANEMKAQKEAVFNSPEYDVINESDGFKSLVDNALNYSVDELKIKCDLLFASYVKQAGKFESKEDVKVKPHSVGVNFNVDPGKKKPYGKLFSK